MKTEKKAEPKKRASRAKKQPTREKTSKLLLDASNELKQNIQEKIQISSLQLKLLPELIKETLTDLNQGLEKMQRGSINSENKYIINNGSIGIS